jgi:hypothetical protein
MELNHAFGQNIFWGVLLILIAVSLIVVGFYGYPIFLIIPLVFVGAGVWIVVTGSSFFNRAWGVVIGLVGGLWLVHLFFSVPVVYIAAVFLAALGVLVIVGTK